MTLKWKTVAAVAVAATLAGCASLGVKPGSSPSLSFTAPVAFDTAYQSALRQTKLCLLGNGGDTAYSLRTQVDDASHTADVNVQAPWGPWLSVVHLEGEGPKSTHVTVTMWGKSPWDINAINAMHDAVTYTQAGCVSYLPNNNTPPTHPREAVPALMY